MKLNFNKIHLKEDETVDYIKSNIRIEDVINRLAGLNLTKTGNSLQGDCPSGHASQGGRCFSVNIDQNYYHCFHCGSGGDVISLVELVQSCSFTEALQWFKENYNLEFPVHESTSVREVKEDNDYYNRQFLNEEIVKNGKVLLHNNKQGELALKYLVEDRGYDSELLQQTEWLYLPQANYLKEQLENKYPSLSKQINELKLVGYFGDGFRLAFPYRDRNGRITGFLKRALEPKGITVKTSDGKEHTNVRWDSTPGTKKEDLFNLNNCKGYDSILIVEGYPDALYLPALGLKNVVAIGQGILSESHLRGLKENKIKKVIISFDNDQPKEDGTITGRENTVKAVELLNAYTDIDVYVIDPLMMESCKDPDELVKAKGVDELVGIMNNAISAEKWMAELIISRYDLKNDQQWKNALDEILDYDYRIKNQLKSTIFLNVAGSLLELNYDELKEYAHSYKEKVAREAAIESCLNYNKKAEGYLHSGNIEGYIKTTEEAVKNSKLLIGRAAAEDDIPLGKFLWDKYDREKLRDADLLGYRLNKFPQIARNIDGVQPGFYLIGADTNIGKTAFATNLFLDILDSNANVKGIYFSLDDNKNIILNRFLGIESGLPLNKLQRKRDDLNDERLVKHAYEKLITLSNEERLFVL